ncbi:MAG: ribonuclease III [Synergistaceae bacterium]|jgi:ribonuclease-3|nr:ribonuclease III [Synergistaceae bacterium]
MNKSDTRDDSLLAFQKKIGYFYKNKELLEQALTHSSYANELKLVFFNERLEFLGDAVLELVASEKLYSQYKDIDEGQLTRLRSQLVCQKSLREWSESVGLNKLIRLGKSLVKEGPTQSVEANAAEAVFGSVFLDGGYENARKVIADYLELQREKVSPDVVDSKTTLQQLIQSQDGEVPYYNTVERKGLDHALKFKVQVTLNEKVMAEAWGNTIKEAEFKAAEKALKKYNTGNNE